MKADGWERKGESNTVRYPEGPLSHHSSSLTLVCLSLSPPPSPLPSFLFVFLSSFRLLTVKSKSSVTGQLDERMEKQNKKQKTEEPTPASHYTHKSHHISLQWIIALER